VTLTAEELAQQFHEAYERLAPSFGYETREASAKPWAEVPEQNRALMRAVVAEVMIPALEAAERERDDAQALLADCQRGRRVAQDEAFARLDRAERAEADAERLAGALKNLYEATCAITDAPDYEVAEVLYVGELGDAEEALRAHEEGKA
jgi:hypothetical protein